ncbi:sodium/hydrogen exchanger 9B2-like [Stegodyphus dumicola]|uniref:sodium/hydrogen exchanger 9B2-like n=1 Tax=Stegodyphus dumicola TaxID=202533 RepID=UPI0015AB7D5E|nr:sodium/hydrogen exchanger 9B2-like [Stegodyphus dumicola]
MQCSPLNLREVIFVSTSWLSKATVQAAVGSQALDYSRTYNKGTEFETHGKQVLMMSVISIILTAPLGAALMNGLGPYLLKKDGSVENQPMESDDEESSPVNERRYTGYSSCSWTSTENYSFSNSERDFSASVLKSPRKLEQHKAQNLLKGNF